MQIWTDGTLVVQVCDWPNILRVFRGGATLDVVEIKRPAWESTLTVDVDSDRIWVSSCGRLHQYRLSDPSESVTHEDAVGQVTALGGGRLAAILLPGGGVGSRLAVGRPGRWEHEVVPDRPG